MGRTLCGVFLAAATVLGFTALAQEEGKKKAGKVTVETVFRSSTIEGMFVYNHEGDRVGRIEELVVDVEKGQVVYAALSVGGFLGAGDKLFAIPWREFELEVDEKDKFFRVDVDKDKLRAAEGFDKDSWPNVADPKWREEIDAQYKATDTTKKERRRILRRDR
jgi:sporulation protein YlmC with PRC-barrel domain